MTDSDGSGEKMAEHHIAGEHTETFKLRNNYSTIYAGFLRHFLGN